MTHNEGACTYIDRCDRLPWSGWDEHPAVCNFVSRGQGHFYLEYESTMPAALFFSFVRRWRILFVKRFDSYKSVGNEADRSLAATGKRRNRDSAICAAWPAHVHTLFLQIDGKNTVMRLFSWYRSRGWLRHQRYEIFQGWTKCCFKAHRIRAEYLVYAGAVRISNFLSIIKRLIIETVRSINLKQGWESFKKCNSFFENWERERERVWNTFLWSCFSEFVS